jgi:hypothetical protein
MSLVEQIVTPNGMSLSRLDEHMLVPASEMLDQGNVPRVAQSGPSELLDVRVLSEVEAQTLAQRAMGVKVRGATTALTETVRVRHHAIARLFAAGRKKSEIAEIMGCGSATLAILERSPAFQALTLEYMNMMDKASVESYTRMKILGNLGMDELTERLATRPSTIKTSEVLEIVKVSADRTGLAPTTKQVTLNGRISPADLRAIKAAKAGTPPEGTEEDHFGGADSDAGVCIEGEFESDSTLGEEVRTLAGEMVTPADEVAGLVADLGEIFGPGR